MLVPGSGRREGEAPPSASGGSMQEVAQWSSGWKESSFGVSLGLTSISATNDVTSLMIHPPCASGSPL